jgi:hypothetical protein
MILTLILSIIYISYVRSFFIIECNQNNCKRTDVNFIIDNSYTSNDGYIIHENSITLYNNISPRLYSIDPITNTYKQINLLNKEIKFDINLATLPGGANAALYFSDMDIHSPIGSGYCDAPGIMGPPCNEMDVFEGNTLNNACTSHSCNQYNCDTDGCAINTRFFDTPYNSDQLNTMKTFTVITQFIANSDTLSQITRKYIQDGNEYDGGTLDSCSSHGGFQTMSSSLKNGMVLVLSIWGNTNINMEWLDGCDPSTYNHHAISNANVIFSNIMVNNINNKLSFNEALLLNTQTPTMSPNILPTISPTIIPICNINESNILYQYTDYIENDISHIYSSSPMDCKELCKSYHGCNAFSWKIVNNRGTCFLKSKKNITEYNVDVISGIV